MPNLTAVIITKNEEARISACLDSLKPFVDQIVIVDDCSTDNTVSVCHSYGAKIIVNASIGDFDNQRNIGIDNSSSEWILQMDADETIPEITAKKIKEYITNPGKFIAFSLKRKNFLLDYPLKYGGAAGNYMTKIFRKDSARYIGKSVHETLKINGKTGKIDAEVYHYPYSSFTQTFSKMNFYTDVVANKFIQDQATVNFAEVKYRLTWKSLKLFWKLYIRKKGFKDGMPGLIWSAINVIGPAMTWIKIWEGANKANELVHKRENK